MTSWIYHEATNVWRQASLARSPDSVRVRRNGVTLTLLPSATPEGIQVWSGSGWSWHPRQVPPCRVCGDTIASPGQAWLVRDDVCAQCQTDGGADPAADFTARRIELRERRAA